MSDETKMRDVPFIAFEATNARLERSARRWMTATAAMFAALIVTNTMWIAVGRRSR